jgi:hypothetical protein
MASPVDPDALSPAELKALVAELLAKLAELERTVAAQREEIARLKGLKGRPKIKPSGMEQATEPTPPRDGKGRRRPPRYRPARSSTATRISWCRTWCCGPRRCATAASAG